MDPWISLEHRRVPALDADSTLHRLRSQDQRKGRTPTLDPESCPSRNTIVSGVHLDLSVRTAITAGMVPEQLQCWSMSQCQQLPCLALGKVKAHRGEPRASHWKHTEWDVSIVTGLGIEWRDSLKDALHADIKGLWSVTHQMSGAQLGERLARW